jgi:hypothetical protein
VLQQQYPRTEVQSINSSSQNIHENLQMKINKKRIQGEEPSLAHHQRI